jgi:hypothetical protein
MASTSNIQNQFSQSRPSPLFFNAYCAVIIWFASFSNPSILAVSDFDYEAAGNMLMKQA